MNILVIGNGGREHTICWKLSQSPKVNKIYCAKGNAGTLNVAENINIEPTDIHNLLNFAKEKNISLTVVGPENPLCDGIVDLFEENGLKIFGPNKKCAMLEKSKEFSKKFMQKYSIDTARYESFYNYEDSINGLETFNYPLVIKADGLCLGKGVFICNTKEEAIKSLTDIFLNKIFGDEGNKIVIEEFLTGIEASLLCLVNKNVIIPLESAKDYKKIFDGDNGPNTGGVGCFSPSPLFNSELQKNIDKVLKKIFDALKAENLDFKGLLFVGFMIENNIPKVLEFNVRFGDPETEVILPRLESDLVDIFLKTIDNTLEKEDLVWKDNISMTTVLTSEGYPDSYKKEYVIDGLDSLDKDIILFHNGTILKDNKVLTNGGRVLSVTVLAEDLSKAREIIYSNINKINFQGMRYRKDIGII